MLRITPGALTSQLLDYRPGDMPTELYLSGGQCLTSVDLICFEDKGATKHKNIQISDLQTYLKAGKSLWLRIQGLKDQDLVQSVLDTLKVPSVLQIPLVQVPQRPQVDCLNSALLVVVHRLGFSTSVGRLVSDQVGLLLLPSLLITVEETQSPEPFPELTEWILSEESDVSKADLDDVLHFLIDDILDNLFPILETISHRLDALEESVLRRPKPKLLSRTFMYRSNLRTIRTQIWPLRHQIQILLRERQSLLGRDALIGFQEMSELVQLLYENCEMLRNQCDAITQAYSVGIGNRMNQVMKTLTIMTSIFAPLTFIAGIYGMNFVNMPELKWRYGYFLVLAVMLIVACMQIFWLCRRGWFQDWTGQKNK